MTKKPGNPRRVANAKNDAIKGESLARNKKREMKMSEAYANLFGPGTVSSRKMVFNPETGRYSVDVKDPPKGKLFSKERREYIRKASAANDALDAAKKDAEKTAEDPTVKAMRLAAKRKRATTKQKAVASANKAKKK